MAIEPLTKCGACGFTQHVLEIKCINCEMTSWRNREIASMQARNRSRSQRQIAERAAKRNG